MTPDVEFFFDPVCPFAWITSRWMRRVAEQRQLDVDWRFISLRLTNADKDYERDFPAGYLDGHTRGLELLRVAAAVREAKGREAVGPLYEAYGAELWESDGGFASPLRQRGDRAAVEAVLRTADLPTELAGAAEDEWWDGIVQTETDLALERAGRDLGTPIITFTSLAGDRSFFGPVISRVPDDEQALVLWDALTTLAGVEGFAELKSSRRERLQLPAVVHRPRN